MSKRIKDVHVETNDIMRGYRMITVHIAPYLLPELRKIEGLDLLDAERHPARPTCAISPLYDWDSVIADIENLGAPIPEAFREQP